MYFHHKDTTKYMQYLNYAQEASYDDYLVSIQAQAHPSSIIMQHHGTTKVFKCLHIKNDSMLSKKHINKEVRNKYNSHSPK